MSKLSDYFGRRISARVPTRIVNTQNNVVLSERERLKEKEEYQKSMSLIKKEDEYSKAFEDYQNSFNDYSKEREEYINAIDNYYSDEVLLKEEKEYENAYSTLIEKSSKTKNALGELTADTSDYDSFINMINEEKKSLLSAGKSEYEKRNPNLSKYVKEGFLTDVDSSGKIVRVYKPYHYAGEVGSKHMELDYTVQDYKIENGKVKETFYSLFGQTFNHGKEAGIEVFEGEVNYYDGSGVLLSEIDKAVVNTGAKSRGIGVVRTAEYDPYGQKLNETTKEYLLKAGLRTVTKVTDYVQGYQYTNIKTKAYKPVVAYIYQPNKTPVRTVVQGDRIMTGNLVGVKNIAGHNYVKFNNVLSNAKPLSVVAKPSVKKINQKAYKLRY